MNDSPMRSTLSSVQHDSSMLRGIAVVERAEQRALFEEFLEASPRRMSIQAVVQVDLARHKATSDR